MPTFVIVICFVSGILLVVLGVPLWLRHVPRNMFYGVRFPSTLSDDDIWYAINAQAGRNLTIIGAVYLVLLSATLAIGRSWNPGVRVGVPTAFLVVALIGNTVAVGKASARLRAAHRVADR